MRRITLLALALPLAAAPLVAQAPVMRATAGVSAVAVSPAATRAEVQQAVRAYVAAHNAADATEMMEMVSRAPGVASVSEGEITRGWDAIRAEADEVTGEEGSYKLSVGTIDVMALGAGHALAVAMLTIKVPTGEAARGAMTIVFERTSDGWRVVNEHFSIKTPEEAPEGES